MEQNREPSNKLINLLSLEKKARIYNRKNTTIFLASDVWKAETPPTKILNKAKCPLSLHLFNTVLEV